MLVLFNIRNVWYRNGAFIQTREGWDERITVLAQPVGHELASYNIHPHHLCIQTRSIRLCYSQNISKQRIKQSERFSLWVLTKIEATDVEILTRVRTPTFSMARGACANRCLESSEPWSSGGMEAMAQHTALLLFTQQGFELPPPFHHLGGVCTWLF